MCTINIRHAKQTTPFNYNYYNNYNSPFCL